jgi:hypothetical protein
MQGSGRSLFKILHICLEGFETSAAVTGLQPAGRDSKPGRPGYGTRALTAFDRGGWRADLCRVT